MDLFKTKTTEVPAWQHVITALRCEIFKKDLKIAELEETVRRQKVRLKNTKKTKTSLLEY